MYGGCLWLRILRFVQKQMNKNITFVLCKDAFDKDVLGLFACIAFVL